MIEEDDDQISEEEKTFLNTSSSPPKSTKSDKEIEAAEKEIAASIKDVRYIVREYPASVVVEKYITGISNDTNEIFVPEYQRELIWPDKNQSRFIESLLIGLPVPFLFVADISAMEDPDNEGRLEIVDGVQRIRTLTRFMIGDLVLQDLERLKSLNGFTFFDLNASRQKRFGRATLRLIELTEAVTEDVRRDMFDRINSGSVGLEAVEVRRGIKKGPFLDLVKELSKNQLLHKLAPISVSMQKRYEYEELVTRFFAFMDRYEEYGTGPEGKVVKDFLMRYVNDANHDMEKNPKLAEEMKAEFENVLSFACKYFPEGFQKSGRGRKVPRVRFEALAVGAGLALRDYPNLVPHNIHKWLDGPKFKRWTTSDASNNRLNLQGRIDFVKTQLAKDG